MGVPALFRWLSKKYPKIILPVVEDDPVKVEDIEGNEVEMPVDMSLPNPNGMEFDNLYLDMNGIVHPCTHPEGKPAPETEAEMMIEVFKYTERVVNMVRPRKVLFLAIDGVAPRAKMNQQRSRRFRSAQEAKEKEEAHIEGVKMFEALGHEVSEEAKNKKAWDSNAITPGTPFMYFLASSLRYWIVQKVNRDPGWKNLQVIISDASVPGEGEHKIMDFIRRQRVNPNHDPNTRHVIYGLDADLIMLSLATHEPQFRVLREDVFSQDISSTACRACGQEGHYAAQCTNPKPEGGPQKKTGPVEKKPFIFLDVPTLREYLEIELNITHATFPFDLEQAIDDWVLLIFYVGNDFLPHLPSLEIREGAIDTLLKIWKDELPRMGGYLTNHGTLELSRAQIILEGLAKRENEIFQRRRESEERQDQNAKRRKLEQQRASGNSMKLNETPYVAVTTSVGTATSIHPTLPQRPAFDMISGVPSASGSSPTTSDQAFLAKGSKAMSGSNHDIVANRHAIRMANMSAAEMLRAEMSSLMPVKAGPRQDPPVIAPLMPSSAPSLPSTTTAFLPDSEDSDIPGLSMSSETVDYTSALGAPQTAPTPVVSAESVTVSSHESSALPKAVSLSREPTQESIDMSLSPGNGSIADITMVSADGSVADTTLVSTASTNPSESPRGQKRKLDDAEQDSEEDAIGEDEVDPSATPAVAVRRVNPDGTVIQEDIVRLWEPGYRERYYRQKFGVELSDEQFRKQITKSYVEGLSWVLQYYYQGTPSWTWYYPYHFAPFAADFDEIDKMEIRFEVGRPFKPYEQLMGVFPAASRQHIPEAFQGLMVDEDSPIIDFYPTEFEIDMNGKKMAWQGVALLPFIDERRLLEALQSRYPDLRDDERERSKPGDDVVYVGQEHKLYEFLCGLYTKRKSTEPIPIDTKLSLGIAGQVLADPHCVPGSTYFPPLPLVTQGLLDIVDDRSISAIFFFPPQTRPHRSVLLPGVRKPPRVLTSADAELVRRGGGRGRGGGGPGGWTGRDNARHSQSYNGSSYGQGGSYGAPQSYGQHGGYPNRADNGYNGNRGWEGRPATPGSYGSGQATHGGSGQRYGGNPNRGSPYGSPHNSPFGSPYGSSPNQGYPMPGGRGRGAINGGSQYPGGSYSGQRGGMQGPSQSNPHYQGGGNPAFYAGHGYATNGGGGGGGRGRGSR